MSTATKPPVASSPAARSSLRWRSWPLRQKLPWSLLLPVGLIVIEWAVALLTGNHVMGSVSVFLLAVSLWRFWIPVDFELSKHGIVQRCLGRTSFIPWRSVKAIQVRHGGVTLLRSRERAAIDLLGNLYLPWGNHRADVLQCLDHLHGTSHGDAHKETLVSTKE